MARIMIVDDSKFQRGMLQRALEASGHVVTSEESGANALETLKTHTVDLFITGLSAS